MIKKEQARHVYANPKDPVVCPVFALSILVFTRALIDRRLRHQFDTFGESGKDRFTKWLSKILV